MKKKLIILFSLFVLLVTGCGNTNTPTGKVEEFLGRYQSMNSDVLTQLDNIISNDTTMSDEQKKDYQALMEKQYQNLSYKVKEEDIDGDNATVLVEIEVYDYANSILKSRDYYNEHRDEFEKNDKDNDDSSDGLLEDTGEAVEDAIDNISSFIEYKIQQLKDVTDKAKYEITFYLYKEDGEWIVEDITDIDRQKIHGLYEI